ncbi:hypothetical protein [Actinomadura sp. 3N407]|uniref:hypothetical protein n=1 Tax=Actinomadura sp. 3N407 TaxID=3457423 RepID=UPI003FCDDDA4
MSRGSGPYRDYLPDRDGMRASIPQAVPVGKPTPGHGTVFVQKYIDGTWAASWQEHYPAPRQDGAVAGVEDYQGTEKEVLAWARSRPAARFLIFSPQDDDYIPLTM